MVASGARAAAHSKLLAWCFCICAKSSTTKRCSMHRRGGGLLRPVFPQKSAGRHHSSIFQEDARLRPVILIPPVESLACLLAELPLGDHAPEDVGRPESLPAQLARQGLRD